MSKAFKAVDTKTFLKITKMLEQNPLDKNVNTLIKNAVTYTNNPLNDDEIANAVLYNDQLILELPRLA